jgi:hypothetical protein
LNGASGRPFLGQIANVRSDGTAAVAFMTRKAALARRLTHCAYQNLCAGANARRILLRRLQIRHRAKRPLARSIKPGPALDAE